MRLKKFLFLFVPLAFLAIPALACVSAADVDYIITGDSSVYGQPGTAQYAQPAQPVYQPPAQQQSPTPIPYNAPQQPLRGGSVDVMDPNVQNSLISDIGSLFSASPWVNDGQHWRSSGMGIEVCVPGHLSPAERDSLSRQAAQNPAMAAQYICK